MSFPSFLVWMQRRIIMTLDTQYSPEQKKNCSLLIHQSFNTPWSFTWFLIFFSSSFFFQPFNLIHPSFILLSLCFIKFVFTLSPVFRNLFTTLKLPHEVWQPFIHPFFYWYNDDERVCLAADDDTDKKVPKLQMTWGCSTSSQSENAWSLTLGKGGL